MLRIQINGFEKVIQKLQGEIVARERSQVETEKLIQSLRDEIAALKGQGPRGQGAGSEGLGFNGRARVKVVRPVSAPE